MLASTMQFSSYERNPPPETGAYPSTPGHHPDDTRSGSPRQRPTRARDPPTHRPAPVPSGPNSVPSHPTHQRKDSTPAETRSTTHQRIEQPTSRRSTHEQPPRNTRPGSGPGPAPPRPHRPHGTEPDAP